MSKLNRLLEIEYKLKDKSFTIQPNCVAVISEGLLGVAENASDGAARIAGVLRDKELNPGEVGVFQMAGIAKIKAAARIEIGDMIVAANTEGHVRPRTIGDHNDTGSLVGRAISAASPGEIVKVILTIPSEHSDE